MTETKQYASHSRMTTPEIYYVLFRHKWLILLSSVLGVLAAAGVYYRTPSVYRSEAKLLVRYVTDDTMIGPQTKGERVRTPDRSGVMVNSELEILSSKDILEEVVDRLGADRFIPEAKTNQMSRMAAVDALYSRLSIEVPKRSNVILLVFDGPSPTVAQAVLNSIIEGYLRKHREVHRAAGTYEFLSQQTDQIRSRLTQIDEELRKVKTEAGVSSPEETRTLLTAQLNELQRVLQESEASFAAGQAHREALRAELKASAGYATAQSPTGTVTQTAFEATHEMQEMLTGLRRRENELLAVYTEDSLPVQAIRRQMAEIRKSLERQAAVLPAVSNVAGVAGAVVTYSPRELLDEEASLAGLEAKVKVLKAQVDQTKNNLKTLDAVDSRLVELTRQREIAEANYKYFSTSLEEARIGDALDQRQVSNISVVQPATVPSRTLRPGLVRNMTWALFIGVMGGLGLAFGREYKFDHTLRRPRDIEAYLHLPLLLSIPKLERSALGVRSKTGEGPAKGDKANAATTTAAITLTEYCDALCDRLLMALPPVEGKPFVLGVTSCNRSAGVTSVATGLALALARNADRRVLLVDAGRGRTDSHRVFGVDPTTALSDFRIDHDGNAALIQHELYVVPSDSATAGKLRVGRDQHFAQVVHHLRDNGAEQRFVILDLPPVSDISLALTVARTMDAVILVIASEESDREVARQARNLLVQAGGTILGAVLNKRRQYVPAWLHPTW
jgi:polysaccharide biosynthesis transport protein